MLSRQRSPIARKIALSGQRIGPQRQGKQPLDLHRYGLGLGQPPLAIFAARHFAVVRFHDVHAIGPQLRQIALRRLMVPHAHIHGGDSQHRLVGSQQQRRRQVVRNAGRHLRQDIGGGRRDHHQVGLTAELDMPDLALGLQVEQVVIHLILGQHAQRQRRHELFGALGKHRPHSDTALAQGTDKLQRLVGGDPAGNDKEDAPGHSERLSESARHSASNSPIPCAAVPMWSRRNPGAGFLACHTDEDNSKVAPTPAAAATIATSA